MANTFKFGNGEWAVGKETALAYNDENSNFKPLPFTFDRGSIATVVNKQGLIEKVGIDEPRIDFLNNTKGHLLLEPSRQNEVTNSVDLLEYFNNTTTVTETSNATTSPDGSVSAYKYEGDGSSTSIRLFENRSFSENTTYSLSVFAKAGTNNFLQLGILGVSGSRTVFFDLSTATASSEFGKIENYGNGWYRCSITADVTTGDLSGNANIYITKSLSETGFDSNSDAQNATMFLWGAQLEAGSYATSYIPTQGETNGVTRSAEIPFGREDMVDLNLYSSEMTWFYDINLFYREAGTTVAPRLINTSNNQVFIGVNTPQSPNTDLRIRHKDGTTALNTNSVTFTNGGRFKIAVKITGTTGTAYINGTNVGTFTTLAASNYDKYENAQNNPNNINDMRFYNTALSDSELQALTQV